MDIERIGSRFNFFTALCTDEMMSQTHSWFYTVPNKIISSRCNKGS